MPNWCANTLTVYGLPEDVAGFAAAVATETTALSLEKIAPTPAAFLADDRWYGWRIDQWGTKWDVEAVISEQQPDRIEYQFDSAWSPPTEAIVAASRQYPALVFHLAYDEPAMDFSGVAVARAGELEESHNDVSPQTLLYRLSFECWLDEQAADRPWPPPPVAAEEISGASSEGIE